MITQGICSGQGQAWKLLHKIGEGDAGEIFTTESLLDRKAAILKRPRFTAFPSDIIRQAGQIEKEGQILSALSCLNRPDRLVIVPQLLDQSAPGSEFSERFFIVIERAKGFNLKFLADVLHSGNLTNKKLTLSADSISSMQLPSEISSMEHRYLELLIARKKIPDLILLRILAGLIDFLEEIHVLEINTHSAKHFGILWNDVKPDHLFWDINEAHLTIVDWGNGQFLQSDGTTADLTLSRMSDHLQLITEMGHFLENFAPDLHTQLSWPTSVSAMNVYSAGILPLKDRLKELLHKEALALQKIQLEESKILQNQIPRYRDYKQLSKIHQKLLEFGEIPDYTGAEAIFRSTAKDLISKGQLSRFKELCAGAASYPVHAAEVFRLLEKLAGITIEYKIPVDALLHGLNGDWLSCLWDLRTAALTPTGTAWWEEISKSIRWLELGSDVLSPFVALNRLIHALHTTVLSAETAEGKQPHIKKSRCTIDLPSLLEKLKNEILPRWTSLEPDPPNSGIEYTEIEAYFDQISRSIPQAGEALIKSLAQPQSQVKITMDAWERKDFNTARRSLRNVLLWDPDRSRILTADRALSVVQDWLLEVQEGLTKDEPLQDFITRLELTGRELRNQIGKAGWLDSMLDAFKQLRKGSEPIEILAQYPEIRDDMGWLISIEPRRPLLTSPGKPVVLERKAAPEYQKAIIYGLKESSISSKSGFFLKNPLDTWVPEARGSSARVFSGELVGSTGENHSVAIKIMRPNRIDYALPLFREEAQILALLQDVPGVTPMLECGFIQFDQKQSIPSEEDHSSTLAMTGKVQRFGLDSVHNFLSDLDYKVAAGLLPYLAIQSQEKNDNLLLHCDTGYTSGHFLPILEGLKFGIQICDILEEAHSRNITFRDHKILHYYWQEAYNGIFMIDWNIARRYPQGVSESEIQFDLVQFGARALHYILTGRPAPGALPMGPNRPEDIDSAARSYAVHWTYDDQRLPGDIKALLEALLNGSYSSARRLREDLYSLYASLVELV